MEAMRNTVKAASAHFPQTRTYYYFGGEPMVTVHDIVDCIVDEKGNHQLTLKGDAGVAISPNWKTVVVKEQK
jgi:hypothetical protein